MIYYPKVFQAFQNPSNSAIFKKGNNQDSCLRYVKEKHKNSKQWLANFPHIGAKSCESSIIISFIKKTKRSSFVGYAPGQASKTSSQRKIDVSETTFWKRQKGWGRHFTITTTTCFDWWKFPQTQTRVIQSDIYVPKCWVDLSWF